MFLFFNIFFSRFLKDTLQRYKVNTENCVTCTNGLKTPTSIVITNKQNGSRTILHHGKLVKLCHICIWPNYSYDMIVLYTNMPYF